MGTATSLLAIILGVVQVATIPSTSTPIERIRTRTPANDLSTLDVTHLAGFFKNPGPSLLKRIGGSSLSGDELYLLPDRTYVYIEWADISPEIICDKGSWIFSSGVVHLSSAPDVKWDPRIDRELVAVRRPSVPNEVLLIGVHRDLTYFEENDGADAEGMLLEVAKERSKELKMPQVTKLKGKLIRDFWKPEFFGKGDK